MQKNRWMNNSIAMAEAMLGTSYAGAAPAADDGGAGALTNGRGGRCAYPREFTISNKEYVSLNIISRKTATNDLKQLVLKGLLTAWYGSVPNLKTISGIG